MPRHHLNQLRFALGNHDKSRSQCRLLPIYYFFEFRYDDKYRKSSPEREIFLLFGTAFLFVCRFVQTVFLRYTNTFTVSNFTAQSMRELTI